MMCLMRVGLVLSKTKELIRNTCLRRENAAGRFVSQRVIVSATREN